MPDLRLRLHDTMSDKLVPLVPRRPGEVRVYSCGPTTHDVAHVGHARGALASDILVRHLREQGMKVTYVRNITDVDDRILERAGASGEPPTELSARMASHYRDDVSALGCVKPEVEPRGSEHLADVVTFIERLIAIGAAYVVTMKSGTRDVYYSVRAFPGYGKLSKRTTEELAVGTPATPPEDKHDPLDFALWRGSPDGGGLDSPWGKGRPGSHIECSAMATRYLDHGFDVHTGGTDLVFPHHENVIAQSEAAHAGEGPFASIWIHNGLVDVDQEKIAKSLGSAVTMRDVYERNDPEGLRYFLLTAHYRGPIPFEIGALPDGRVTFPGVSEAERRVDYLYATLDRLRQLGNAPTKGTLTRMPAELVPFTKIVHDARPRVDSALDDDLNTPVALAVIADVAKAANELVDLAQKRRKDSAIFDAAPIVAGQLLWALRSVLQPLGLLQTPPEEYLARTRARRLGLLGRTAEQIDSRLAESSAARQAKDSGRADAILAELEALGIETSDSPAGPTWRIRAQ